MFLIKYDSDERISIVIYVHLATFPSIHASVHPPSHSSICFHPSICVIIYSSCHTAATLLQQNSPFSSDFSFLHLFVLLQTWTSVVPNLESARTVAASTRWEATAASVTMDLSRAQLELNALVRPMLPAGLRLTLISLSLSILWYLCQHSLLFESVFNKITFLFFLYDLNNVSNYPTVS